MDNGKGCFPDDTVNGARSALRRQLTRSPTRYGLSMRRVGMADNSSTTSSAASSVASFDSDAPSTCVFRETSSEDCDLDRFIVWTAVKRNECSAMTEEEKRECPLLRCRKRFPTHELMLKHLYTCEHYSSREYWCYECGRAEQIPLDSKCRRCFGQPSRRKKIISMAKGLFKSLGHKSKPNEMEAAAQADPQPTREEAPLSYASILEPQEAELFSTEIHEIDSSEVPLATIHEDVEDLEQCMIGDSSPRLSFGYMGSLSRRSSLSSTKWHFADEEPMEWHTARAVSPPVTVAPMSLMKSTAGKILHDRPMLHLQTEDLEKCRDWTKRRSKMLAPSTSVRSTSSTDSSNSMSSIATSNVSTISGWSGAWTRASDFDSAMTSPADDMVNPAELFASDSFGTSHKSEFEGKPDMKDEAAESFLSELPAEIPVINVLTVSDPLQGTLGMVDSVFGYGAPNPTELLMDPRLSVADGSNAGHGKQQATEPMSNTDIHGINACSLIEAAHGALETHISESMDKLKDVSNNHLVDQLRNLSPEVIALAGLETMTGVLQGRQESSPVKVLSFIHLIYSFSIVIQERNAPSRWSRLFAQSLSYSSWFSQQDRQAYLSVVYTLWKPGNTTDEELSHIPRTEQGVPGASEGNQKGKEMEAIGPEPLGFVAQYFLDELEISALRDGCKPGIQTSKLCMQHMTDVNPPTDRNSHFVCAVRYIIGSLSSLYSDNIGLVSNMRHMLGRFHSGRVPTIRRLELELMQAGKAHLPTETYFDDYILQVRTHMDSVYGQNASFFHPRLTYYQHGIELMQAVIAGSHERNAIPGRATQSVEADLDMDNFIRSITGQFGLDHIFDQAGLASNDAISMGNIQWPPTPSSSEAAFTIPALAAEQGQDATQRLPTPTSRTPSRNSVLAMATATTTATTPVPVPTPSSSSTAVAAMSLEKTEADSCCEICGYRPKGDPRWFGGSMAKHKKLQHASSPPKIYRCSFPGCTSQYKNRPDNLRQHQIEKGHFVEGQEESSGRPNKRKKTAI